MSKQRDKDQKDRFRCCRCQKWALKLFYVNGRWQPLCKKHKPVVVAR